MKAGSKLGGYEIIALIGSGGMGEQVREVVSAHVASICHFEP
jgi:hypothetical protein